MSKRLYANSVPIICPHCRQENCDCPTEPPEYMTKGIYERFKQLEQENARLREVLTKIKMITKDTNVAYEAIIALEE